LASTRGAFVNGDFAVPGACAFGVFASALAEIEFVFSVAGVVDVLVEAAAASAAFAGSSAATGFNAIAATTITATHAPLRNPFPDEPDLTP
jgi:hypothetical protein